MRAKSLRVSPNVNDSYSTKQKAWDRELDSFESAVRQGVNPTGTKQHLIDKAIKEADSA